MRGRSDGQLTNCRYIYQSPIHIHWPWVHFLVFQAQQCTIFVSDCVRLIYAGVLVLGVMRKDNTLGMHWLSPRAPSPTTGKYNSADARSSKAGKKRSVIKKIFKFVSTYIVTAGFYILSEKNIYFFASNVCYMYLLNHVVMVTESRKTET